MVPEEEKKGGGGVPEVGGSDLGFCHDSKLCVQASKDFPAV